MPLIRGGKDGHPQSTEDWEREGLKAGRLRKTRKIPTWTEAAGQEGGLKTSKAKEGPAQSRVVSITGTDSLTRAK